ncbi:MAG: cysteine desulfurase [Sphingomonadales bacterium]|nr:cysteine desulfurase [Sphingomonadales bacterium]
MIYLDYQATTPLAPEAFAAMEPWLRDNHGNPHSANVAGRTAAAGVETARLAIAAMFTSGGRLVFTSGATEAINLAIRGALPPSPEGARNRIVTIATEHAAVLDTVSHMATLGYEAVLLPVGGDGIVDLAAARDAIDHRTALVAAMQINNEIGVIQPLAELAALAHAHDTLLLSDCVQGFGRYAVPEVADMIAISAHKIHGPKGIGALWVRDGVTIAPLIHGGGQEQGLRSGTLSPALCAGFGAAATLALARRGEDMRHVEALWRAAGPALSGWTINGSIDRRYHGNLNIRRDGLDAARLMSELRDIAFSLGSACASGSGRPSHVLGAIGLSPEQARSSIRLGFGRYTSEADLVAALDRINAAVAEQAIV